jgi:ABC-2 type transport system permease protein
MTDLVGTGKLVRFILRRERIRLSIWLLVLTLVPVQTANAFKALYPTEASRELLVNTVGANPAFAALLGPIFGTSIGAVTVWRVGVIGALLVGLMAVLTVVRHTREEEETGRRELLGATVVGRHAPLTAALGVTAGAGLLLGLMLVGGFIGIGLDTEGALAFGFGFAASALAFAAVAGVAGQLTEGAGAARGIAITSVGAAFVLRMLGDGGGLPFASWLSPIGWFTQLRPFAGSGERWWVLLLPVGFAFVVGTVGFLLSARRDVGAGALPPRPGPAYGAPSLGTPFGLAVRLQRGSLLGWSLGLAALGVVYGSVGDSIGDLLTDSPELAEIFELLGGEQGITDAYFAAAMAILATIASAYAIRAALRLRVEEEGLLGEPVLATAVSRPRWAWSHLFYALVGPILILAIAGLGAGLTYGAVVGDVGGELSSILGAALIQVPAVWVVVGVATALYGLLPRMTSVSWGVLVGCLVFGQLGEILQFPQWLLNLSPFTHVPNLPVAKFSIVPLIGLTVIAAGLVAVGLVGFRRRDIG